MEVREDGTEVYTINVVDTETTGFAPPPNGDIVEIAVTQLSVEYSQGALKDIYMRKTISTLARPRAQIHFEAMAIHHITPAMVASAKPSREVLDHYENLPCDFWAAHNASFDRKFFSPNTGSWLCTLKIAQTLWPNAPSHKNQVLRYWLDLDKNFDSMRMGDSHRAGFDTYVTAHLLTHALALQKMSLQDMNALCGSPHMIGNIPFGKHKGTPWKDLPISYLSWLAQNSSEEEIRKTAKHYMGVGRR